MKSALVFVICMFLATRVMAGDINTTHGAILVVSSDPSTVTAKSVHGPVIVAPTTDEVMKLYTLWYGHMKDLLDRYERSKQ